MPKSYEELMHEARQPTSVPMHHGMVEGLPNEIAAGVPREGPGFDIAYRERPVADPKEVEAPAQEPETTSEPARDPLAELAVHYNEVGPAADRLETWRNTQSIRDIATQTTDLFTPSPVDLDILRRTGPGGAPAVVAKKIATAPVNWFLASFNKGDEHSRALTLMAKEHGPVERRQLAPDTIKALEDDPYILHGLWASGIVSDELYADIVPQEQWVTLEPREAEGVLMTLGEETIDQILEKLDDIDIATAE